MQRERNMFRTEQELKIISAEIENNDVGSLKNNILEVFNETDTIEVIDGKYLVHTMEKK